MIVPLLTIAPSIVSKLTDKPVTVAYPASAVPEAAIVPLLLTLPNIVEA